MSTDAAEIRDLSAGRQSAMMTGELPANDEALPRIRNGFVVCPSFHGATLLALLLNNHSQVSALGDTNPSREYDQICSCGQPVSACPFWRIVTRRLDAPRFAHQPTLLPNLPWPLLKRSLEGGRLARSGNATGNRAAGRLASVAVDASLSVLWRRRSRRAAGHAMLWNSFYELVAELHQTSVVIDGTKSSRKVALLTRELENSAGLIHLVRDPRGFVASCRRRNSAVDLRATAWLWADLHTRIERLASEIPYVRVRYEDLATRPQRELDRLFDFLKLPTEPVVAPPRFADKHHLMGNAMLFDFTGEVSRDDRWRHELSAAEQHLVVGSVARIAGRYGYGSFDQS